MVNHSLERKYESPGGHALWKSDVVRIRTRIPWRSTALTTRPQTRGLQYIYIYIYIYIYNSRYLNGKKDNIKIIRYV